MKTILNKISFYKISTLFIILLINLFLIPSFFFVSARQPVIPGGHPLDNIYNQACNGACAGAVICSCPSYAVTGSDRKKYQCVRTDYLEDDGSTNSYCIAPALPATGVVNALTKPVNTCPDQMLYDSALGCIPPTTTGITNFTLRLLIGLAMGVAVFKGTFAIWKWRNAESPDKKQEAIKELMAVFMGLVILFIGIPILAFVGIDILNLDQFTNGELAKIFN